METAYCTCRLFQVQLKTIRLLYLYGRRAATELPAHLWLNKQSDDIFSGTGVISLQ